MPDPPQETASFEPQSIDVSNSDTVLLISSLLDGKLHNTFGDFKRSLDEREVETLGELKKLKTDPKAASSLQFKGNRIQFEFNIELLDCLDLAMSNSFCPRETCCLSKNFSKRPSLTSRNALR